MNNEETKRKMENSKNALNETMSVLFQYSQGLLADSNAFNPDHLSKYVQDLDRSLREYEMAVHEYMQR
jgi:hypothetical protein